MRAPLTLLALPTAPCLEDGDVTLLAASTAKPAAAVTRVFGRRSATYQSTGHTLWDVSDGSLESWSQLMPSLANEEPVSWDLRLSDGAAYTEVIRFTKHTGLIPSSATSGSGSSSTREHGHSHSGTGTGTGTGTATPLCMARAQAMRLVKLCQGLDEAVLQVVKALLGEGEGEDQTEGDVTLAGADAVGHGQGVAVGGVGEAVELEGEGEDGADAVAPAPGLAPRPRPTKEAWLDSILVESARYSESRTATMSRFTCSRKVVALQSV